jgi:hypothetical protein
VPAAAIARCGSTGHSQLTCLPQPAYLQRLFPRVPQEYISLAHSLRDGIEQSLRSKGIDASPATPANLPWFDLLAHPAA